MRGCGSFKGAEMPGVVDSFGLIIRGWLSEFIGNVLK